MSTKNLTTNILVTEGIKTENRCHWKPMDESNDSLIIFDFKSANEFKEIITP